MRWVFVVALIGCEPPARVPRTIDVARHLAGESCADTSVRVSSTPYDDDQFVTFRADGCGRATYLQCWHRMRPSYACCHEVSSSAYRYLFRYEPLAARCEKTHLVD
jgi:hypothetical protein